MSVNQVIAPALTEEERRTLYDNRNSELFRLYSKAITWAYSLEAAKLVSASVSDLPRVQGVLQGLLAARGIVMTQALNGAPTEEKLRKHLFKTHSQEK